MDNPYGYTVPLALFDYLPVLLSGLGALWLSRAAYGRTPGVRPYALLGTALVVAGGFCKATWKLLVASGAGDFERLEQSLFPLLATGFSLLAWSLLSGVRERAMAWWPFAAVWGLAVVGALATRTVRPLFFTTVVLSLAVTAYAIRLAQKGHERPAIWLFAAQVIGSLTLVPLQRLEPTLAVQWLEESINTVAQGAFALGAWRVLRALSARDAVPAGEAPAAPREGNRS
jgi:hypothetical protein